MSRPVPSGEPEAMNSLDSLFASQFKPRLQSQVQEVQYPLPDVQVNRVASWVDLFAETDQSLKKRSSSRRSVRRRARHFARKVYVICPELFVLCSLSYTISNLPAIASITFYSELEDWWASTSPPESLYKITNATCQSVPRDTENSRNSTEAPPGPSELRNSQECHSSPGERPNVVGRDSMWHNHNVAILYSDPGHDRYKSSRYEQASSNEINDYLNEEPNERLPKCPRLESQVLGHPTLFSNGPYLSFSFMRRYMIDKLPEQFRRGIETSKLWKD
ncbi:hypothetical protein BO94DRAFT_575221 [Aspergillus sclerotioniger CBS 115572]|uniref:Uncharacterized protein n=1 Tax=Aspergillus sclerotioniger CBS 115572 TaxID=1450535 RepID=A0A317WL98_9EURO|nr:hypothetical protein BO94DRAFT_575221 [Aspergillus sclerotioniger CBS 115572]PWY87099.1 hypothetical protein BO94DRAFT_575221 [Aspergillus sclerotioniger CBS 115572]